MDKLARYMTKANLSRCFGVSLPTVSRRVKGIEEEIKRGRYTRYAIADNLICIPVYLDYTKYQKRLNDKNLRRTVPDFDDCAAMEYLVEVRE